MKLKLILLVVMATARFSDEAPSQDEGMLLECGSEERKLNVYSLMSAYVVSGEIPFSEAMSIQASSGTKKEKLELIVEALRDNGLPPLPPCLNVTGSYRRVVYFEPVATEEKVPAKGEGSEAERNENSKVPVEVSKMSAEERRKVCGFVFVVTCNCELI